MNGHATVACDMVAQARGGHTNPAAVAPFLVLDLGRGCDPHQARCRRCRWQSRWRATTAQAQAQARHQAAAHRRRPAWRGGRLWLVTRGWAR